MRTYIPLAALVAAFTLSSAPAFAADGGVTVGSAPASSAPVTSAGPATGDGAEGDLETRTVTLTRTQTKSVQKRVHVKPDGAIGAGTRKALRRFQARKALTLTGRPNVETLRGLGLKLADKIEAKLRAAATQTTTMKTVAGPGDSVTGTAIAAAQAVIGTPYKSGGTTPSGFDCSGLMVYIFNKAGVTLPRTSFDQFDEGTAVDKSQIQPGDLVFFDSAGAGASHVGIATSATTVISATTHGVMEHSIASGYWAGHYLGARRLSAPLAKAASVR